MVASLAGWKWSAKWADLFRDITTLLAVLLAAQLAYYYGVGIASNPFSFWNGFITVIAFSLFLTLTIMGDVGRAKAKEWGIL
jgi:hypothetical protein